MHEPGRKWTASDYRFTGVNGQEKANEIFANASSAEYWMYDARVLRRWERDPISYPWQSPYTCFNNNPVYFADPLGLEGEEPKAGETRTNKDGSISTYNGKEWLSTPVGQSNSPDHAVPLPEIEIGSNGSATITRTENAANANIDNSERALQTPFDIKHPDPNYKSSPEQKAWYSLSDNFPIISGIAIIIPFVAEPLAVATVEELSGVPIWTTLGGGVIKSIVKQEEKSLLKETTKDLVGTRRTHILNGHKHGSGKPGKTEFPSTWTDDKIINEVNRIANDVNAPSGVGKWDSPYKTGTIDGIKVSVDFYPSSHPNTGKVSTAYPLNVTPNPK